MNTPRSGKVTPSVLKTVPSVVEVKEAPATAAVITRRSPRDTTFDILKGIGIVEVILHHTLGFCARKYAVEGEANWWAMTLVHDMLHFAVPMFLLASALLLARSLAAKPKLDWKRFYARRAERSLWPYVVWSLLYLAFRLWVQKDGVDLYPVSVTIPGFGTRTLPIMLADGAAWRSYLLWGKAYFHLYFLAVLLQFSAIFPLLFYALRRVQLGFGGVLLISALLQWLCFVLQAHYFSHFATPASTILWYVPSLLIGVWLGLNWEQWPQIWSAWRWPLLGMMLAGFGLYIHLSIQEHLNQPVTSLTYNVAYAAYALGASLCGLAGAQLLSRGARAGKVLARVGEWSLPLFLIHPLWYFFFSGPRIGRILEALPLTVCWVFAAVFGLTWGLSTLTEKLHVDRWLFGRSLTPTGK